MLSLNTFKEMFVNAFQFHYKSAYKNALILTIVTMMATVLYTIPQQLFKMELTTSIIYMSIFVVLVSSALVKSIRLFPLHTKTSTVFKLYKQKTFLMLGLFSFPQIMSYLSIYNGFVAPFYGLDSVSIVLFFISIGMLLLTPFIFFIDFELVNGNNVKTSFLKIKENYKNYLKFTIIGIALFFGYFFCWYFSLQLASHFVGELQADNWKTAAYLFFGLVGTVMVITFWQSIVREIYQQVNVLHVFKEVIEEHTEVIESDNATQPM